MQVGSVSRAFPFWLNPLKIYFDSVLNIIYLSENTENENHLEFKVFLCTLWFGLQSIKAVEVILQFAAGCGD